MTSDRPHLLVLEPDRRGHSLEWLRHLVSHAAATAGAPRLSLAVAPELCAPLRAAGAQCGQDGVSVYGLSRREEALCTHRSLVVSAFARWGAMRRYQRRSGATHCHFLELDHLSLPLALGLRLGAAISGILFRPSVHYRSHGLTRRRSAREWLRDLRKDILYRRMLRNSCVERVLSLDPYFPDYAAKRYGGGHKVGAVADPVCPVEGPRPELPGCFPDDGRMRFLLFGSLIERKGVVVLLEALLRLPPEIAARLAAAIVGHLAPGSRSAVLRGLTRLRLERPELWCALRVGRVAEDALAGLVERSDVILAPYQRCVGSSGVLLWAAAAGKPVIVQDYGLLGRFARLHRLGLVIDSTDPEALARGIAKAVTEGPERLADPASMRAFVAARTPDRFAAAVLDCRALVRKAAWRGARSSADGPLAVERREPA